MLIFEPGIDSDRQLQNSVPEFYENMPVAERTQWVVALRALQHQTTRLQRSFGTDQVSAAHRYAMRSFENTWSDPTAQYADAFGVFSQLMDGVMRLCDRAEELPVTFGPCAGEPEADMIARRDYESTVHSRAWGARQYVALVTELLAEAKAWSRHPQQQARRTSGDVLVIDAAIGWQASCGPEQTLQGCPQYDARQHDIFRAEARLLLNNVCVWHGAGTGRSASS